MERSLQDMAQRKQLRDGVETSGLAMAMVGGFWGVYAVWSKELIATADLETELLRCFLSYLYPVSRPPVQRDLERRLAAKTTGD